MLGYLLFAAMVGLAAFVVGWVAGCGYAVWHGWAEEIGAGTAKEFRRKFADLKAENEALWSEVLAKNVDDGWNLYLITDSELADVIFESKAKARDAFRRAKGLKEGEPCPSAPR